MSNDALLQKGIRTFTPNTNQCKAMLIDTLDFSSLNSDILLRVILH